MPAHLLLPHLPQRLRFGVRRPRPPAPEPPAQTHVTKTVARLGSYSDRPPPLPLPLLQVRPRAPPTLSAATVALTAATL
jgi:hypothetical protein